MKIDGKAAFMFYMNWKKQIDELDDQELRRLINNLINYHLDEEIELLTKVDKLVWNGILPGLEANQDKYEKRILANRENGSKGGAPEGNQNARKDKNNPNQPKQPDNREQVNDNSKNINSNSEKEKEKKEEINVNNKQGKEIDKTKVNVEVPISGSSSISSKSSNSNTGISMHEFYKQRGLL